MRIISFILAVFLASPIMGAETAKVKEAKAIRLLKDVQGVVYVREAAAPRPVTEVHIRNIKFDDSLLKTVIYGFSDSLEVLNLEGSAITDQGIKMINGPKLRKLNLACTDVSDAAVAELTARLPNVVIDWQLTVAAQKHIETILAPKNIILKRNNRGEVVDIEGLDSKTKDFPGDVWTGDDIRWIGGFTEAKRLSLGYQAALTKDNCKYLRHFKDLGEIGLRLAHRADDDVIGFFCQTYPKLTTVDITLCRGLTIKSLEHIGSLKQLTTLSTTGTVVAGTITKQEMEFIARSPLIATLDCQATTTDEPGVVPILEQMARSGKLEHLRIDISLPAVRFLKQIQTLEVCNANGDKY